MTSNFWKNHTWTKLKQINWKLHLYYLLELIEQPIVSVFTLCKIKKGMYGSY